jgi:hypothetical protein
VTPLLLDEHLADKNLARQLRAAGCVIETPQEAGLLGLDDPSILEAAIQRDAVFVSFNQRHFVPLHCVWGTITEQPWHTSAIPRGAGAT